MKCPKCRKSIDRIVVVSKCWQYADIVETKESNVAKPRFLIEDYGHVEQILETLSTTCPECDKDLSEYLVR